MCEKCEDRKQQEEILKQLELEKHNKDYHTKKKIELLGLIEKAQLLILKGKYEEAVDILEQVIMNCRTHTY